jgi:uncharacterized protein DUF2695
LGVLTSRGFFRELDNRFCPTDSAAKRERCAGNHVVSKSILKSLAFDETSIGEIIDVLRSQGGCCDCEVLYNVAETSRLKSEYWHVRAKSLGHMNHGIPK